MHKSYLVIAKSIEHPQLFKLYACDTLYRINDFFAIQNCILIAIYVTKKAVTLFNIVKKEYGASIENEIKIADVHMLTEFKFSYSSITLTDIGNRCKSLGGIFIIDYDRLFGKKIPIRPNAQYTMNQSGIAVCVCEKCENIFRNRRLYKKHKFKCLHNIHPYE
jgi:hypothetical protein